MMNNKGVGLIGLLIAVVIVGVLTAAVMKRYLGATHSVLSRTGVSAPAVPGGTKKVAGQKGAPARPACKGRLVGNICVPTEVQSSSLDAFENMNK